MSNNGATFTWNIVPLTHERVFTSVVVNNKLKEEGVSGI